MAFAESPGWYVISLRPQGGHESLRRAAAAHGAGLIALSPWRIQPRTDEPARQALRTALAASRVVFTSPAAVKAAAVLLPLRRIAAQEWIAVGSGTARALGRVGIEGVVSPSRMDSEGLLALPALQEVSGHTVGLITAPGGRDTLSRTLIQRAAHLLRADVYAREPVRLSARSVHKLLTLQVPAIVLISSQGALQQVLEAAPANAAKALRALPAVAASARLQEMARQEGFADPFLSEGPLPAQLIAAASRRFR